MQGYIKNRKEGNMDPTYQKQLETLQEIVKKGVSLYYEEQQVLPTDIVREGMCYEPEFIVMDENGNLKEIWY